MAWEAPCDFGCVILALNLLSSCVEELLDPVE